MWQIFILKTQNKKLSDKGFITIEVVIALFIAFAFLMVSLQTMVAAMAFKLQAQEEQKANKLIQEDIERLNDIGSRLPLVLDRCDGDENNDGTADDGYSQALWDALQADTPDGDSDLQVRLVVTASGTEAGKTLTLTRDPDLSVTTSGSPNRILGISYLVADDDGTEIINRYVEVIPDAALECS